jgi:hypothetical protein
MTPPDPHPRTGDHGAGRRRFHLARNVAKLRKLKLRNLLVFSATRCASRPVSRRPISGLFWSLKARPGKQPQQKSSLTPMPAMPANGSGQRAQSMTNGTRS